MAEKTELYLAGDVDVRRDNNKRTHRIAGGRLVSQLKGDDKLTDEELEPLVANGIARMPTPGERALAETSEQRAKVESTRRESARDRAAVVAKFDHQRASIHQKYDERKSEELAAVADKEAAELAAFDKKAGAKLESLSEKATPEGATDAELAAARAAGAGATAPAGAGAGAGTTR